MKKVVFFFVLLNLTISAQDVITKTVPDLRLDMLDGLLEAGQYQLIWNAIEFPSGVYFIQLRTTDTIQTHKAILMK
ncbi:MAG: hypothetical protein KAK01_11225 [Candidatus Marinimicrobia bacterium]|nr:hypothetical protein [Candidatus Neomarinimicrobiota bacterium]